MKRGERAKEIDRNSPDEVRIGLARETAERLAFLLFISRHLTRREHRLTRAGLTISVRADERAEEKRQS